MKTIVLLLFAVQTVIVVSSPALSSEPPSAPGAVEFFEKKIRPLLVEHCQKCHAGEKVKGGLHLTARNRLLQGGETGPALVPGDPDKSLLIRSVRYTQEHLQMPPKGKLSDVQIADLTRWVKEGAAWPESGSENETVKAGNGRPLFTQEQKEFWAFQPIRDPAPPTVKNPGWVQSPIDSFLLHTLEARGLQPATPADRRTLIRRATLDLTGLPPTPEEVEQFLADSRPDALAHLIDRLLASPAYGERWGRHWLDVARYADSNGLDENTAFANAWRYRDYVVRAFNQDKPYDQFVIEQIAGDLLPSSGNESLDQDRLTATGFLVLGPKVLAEPDKQKMVMDIVDEQLDVTFRAFLGLTAGCARCHDHKFDPLPTRDYYSLAGIFKSTRTMASLNTVARANERSLASKELEARADRARKEHDAVQQKINAVKDQASRTIRHSYRRDFVKYLLAASDLAPDGKRKQEPSDPKVRVRTGRLEDLARDNRLNPEAIRVWNRYLRERKKQGNDPIFGPFLMLADLPTESFAMAAEGVVREIQSEIKAGKSKLLRPVQQLFVSDFPRTLAEVAARYGQLKDEIEKLGDNASKDPDQQKLREVLLGGQGPWNQVNVPQEAFLEKDREEIKKLQTQLAALPPVPAIPMVLSVRDESKIENVKVHIRGNHMTLGAETPRQFPQILAGEKQKPLGNQQSGRLELARWMTQPDHPLTARVMVNRIWQHHFGEGLVRSPDNFGKLGDRPSHPELLDWLARRFMEKGWSIKAMHRLIMLSQAYQMSSEPSDRASQIDPDNRLLWHMPRRRMEVEAIRDSILAISGKLDRTQGGLLLNVNNFDYVTNDGSGNNASYNTPRRSIYLPVIRNAVYDVFQVFDFVEPSVLNGHRDSTTVAPQALFLMNGPFVLEQSRALAEKLLSKAADDDPARLRYLYSLTFSRLPVESEIAQAMTYLHGIRERLKSTIPQEEKRRLRSWQSLCQVLFASNEFVFIH